MSLQELNCSLLQESDEDDPIIDESPDLQEVEDEPDARSLLRPVNPTSVQKSLETSTQVRTIPVTSQVQSVALSKRATDIRRRVQLRGLMQQVPSTLPANPSAVLNLGKSIALPVTKLTGKASKD